MLVEPPGKYCAQLSLDPLKQLKAFMHGMEDYIDGLQAKHRAPVFKCHPGRKTVMLTDNASGAFYFRAPTDLLDRDGGSRVGCGVLGLTESAVPLLVTRGERHRAGRAVMADILEARRADFMPALNRAFEAATSRWLRQGGFNLKLAVREVMMDFAFQWIFDQRLTMFDINNLHELCYFPKLYTDTAATRPLTPLIANKYTADEDQARANYATAARESRHFDEYRQMAERHGLPLDDLEHFLSSNAVGNIVGAPRLILVPALARMTIEPSIVGQLIDSRPDVSSPKTLMENRPLHHIFLEVNRLYPRPRFMYKIAQQDFGLPAGDGQTYAIRQGDAVCVCFPQVNRDPNVYARPDDFRPVRYAENPALERKLYLYSWAEGAKHPYGCLSRAGRQGEVIVKYLCGRLLTEFEWSFAQTPIFDKNLYLEVGPTNLSAVNFRRRSA